MRTFVRLIVGAAAAAVVCLVALSVWWAHVTIDETIYTGAKWGVVIGESSRQTLNRLLERHRDKDARVAVRDESSPPSVGARSLYVGPLRGAPKEILFAAKSWTVFWDYDYHSDLTLVFADSRLLSARLTRTPIELP